MRTARSFFIGVCAIAVCLLAQLPTPSRSQPATPAPQTTEPPNSGKSIWTQNVTKFRKAHGAVGGYKKRWDLSDLPHYVPKRHLTGTLRIWGNNYIKDGDLAKYWQDGFAKYQPGIKIVYHLPTIAVAIPALATGVADLGMSNKATLSDLVTFEQVFHHPVSQVMVLTGSYDVYGWSPAFIFVVNKDNPLTQISMKQLDGVFGGARYGGYEGSVWHTDPPYSRGADENIRTWGQLGLTGDWANKPIHVCGQNLKAGASSNLDDKLLFGSYQFVEGYHAFTNYIAPDGSVVAWSTQERHFIAKDPYALCYASPVSMGPELKELALQGWTGGPYVKRSLESIHDRTYPLVAEEYFFYNRAPGKPLDPKIDEFLHYILSQEGQDAIQREGRYTPLMAPVVREQLKKLE